MRMKRIVFFISLLCAATLTVHAQEGFSTDAQISATQKDASMQALSATQAAAPGDSLAQDIPTAPFLPAQQALAKQTNAPITVQFPQENTKMPRGAKAIFVFGQVNLPHPKDLHINNQSVPLQKDGTFLAYVPVESGDFTLLFSVTDGKTTYLAERHIHVRGKDIKDFSKEAAFDSSELYPQHDIETIPGDTLRLYVRGTPGAQVVASLAGLKNGRKILLQEDPSNPGTYRGPFAIDKNQKHKTVKVIYKMTNGPDNTHAKITAPGKITVRSKEHIFSCAQISHPGIKVRQLPTSSGNLFPHYRAFGQVQVTGKRNNQYHIWLNQEEQAWLEDSKIEPIPCPQEKPTNFITGFQTTNLDNKTQAVIETSRAVPIQIQEFKDRLEVKIYYVSGVEENFSMDNTSPLLDTIRWSRPTDDTLLLKFNFAKGARLWGYAYRFNEEGQLEIDFIHPPLLSPTRNLPLRGARILIDAGHNPKRTAPYDGAVGPTGYLEYEGTLALAEELKTALEKKGATVILTRHDKNRMTLEQRYEHALKNQAHIFVSLHYNAFSETVNPLARPRGFQVYYTYPHSFDLASAVHKAYIKHVPLPDNGLIANTVLFIPRIPDMPSILVESAYLMFPEQEEMARTKEGRAKFARALESGIINFFQKMNP